MKDQTVATVEALAKQVIENEGKVFNIQQVANAFQEIGETLKYRHDQVIRNLGSIFEGMAKENNLRLISAYEIQGFYDHLITLNPESECKSVFAHLFPGQSSSVFDEQRQERHIKTAESMRDHFTSDTVREIQARDGESVMTKQVSLEVDEYQHVEVQAQRAEAFESFHEEVDSSLIESTLRYDRALVQKGKQLVASELNSIGISKIAVYVHAKQNDNQLNPIINYQAFVEIDGKRADLAVPIEIKNNIPLFPTEFTLGEEIFALTADGLSKAFKTEKVSQVRYDGRMLEMTYNQLLGELHSAACVKNVLRANECLNLIGDKFGQDHLKSAVQDYQDALIQSSVDHSSQCAGCSFYANPQEKRATHSVHFCNKLNLACSKVKMVKGSVASKDNICIKAEAKLDEEKDTAYDGQISTSQIQMT